MSTKTQVSLKFEKNNGYPTLGVTNTCNDISLNEKNVRQNSQRKLKRAFYLQYILPHNRAVYDVMYKKAEESERPQITIWRMPFVCWIPKATDTHSEYVIRIAFPRQQYLRESASV
jgi:hypothetical protein